MTSREVGSSSGTKGLDDGDGVVLLADDAGAEDVGEDDEGRVGGGNAQEEQDAPRDPDERHRGHHHGDNHHLHHQPPRHKRRRREGGDDGRAMRAAVTTTTTINYLDDPRKRVGREHEQWQAGTIVTTPEGGLRLIILRRIDDGHAGVVFKVRDDRGTILALKVPRKESEKQYKKLHQEVAKNARLLSLGLSVAEIIEEGGDYLLKKWIDGLRGDHWFIQWNEKGRPLDDPGWKQLCTMFDMLAAKGVYVQNLKDLNMIFDGQQWVVIDVGYFKAGLTPQQALGRFYDTFDCRWNKPRYNRSRFMFLCPSIAVLRGHGPEHYVKREPSRTERKMANGTRPNAHDDDLTLPFLPPRLGENGGTGAGGLRIGAIGLASPKASASHLDAVNEIKRKQAEAALAVIEDSKVRKKKKKKQPSSSVPATANAEGDDSDSPAPKAVSLPSPGNNTVDGRKKDGEGLRKSNEQQSARNKKGSSESQNKDEEVKDAAKDKGRQEPKLKKQKELKEKKERDLQEKRREKELRKEERKKEKEDRKRKKKEGKERKKN